MCLNVTTRRQFWRKIDNRQDRQLRVERVADTLGELLGIKRLRKEKHFVVALSAGTMRLVEITGNKNDFGVGTNFAQPIGEMASAHFGHHNIGEQKIDMAAGALADETLRIVTTGGF